MPRPTLKPSETGKVRIVQAKNERGWTIEHEEPLIAASEYLEPQTNWQAADYGKYAKGVSQPTWKRFLAGHKINSKVFQAFCQILGLNWEEIVDRSILNTQPGTQTKVDLTCAPDLVALYGRSQILTQVQHWILAEQPTERRRLIVLHGQAGIGKSCLARQLAEAVQHQFEYVIWRSQDNEFVLSELLPELTQWVQADSLKSTAPTDLIERLQQQRCLVILDDWETLLDIGDRAGRYKPPYQDYERFLERIFETSHQSCVLILSRELPKHLERLERRSLGILQLRGLEEQGAKDLLLAEGLRGDHNQLTQFSRRFSNPWVLKQNARLIREEWDGSIEAFSGTVTLFDPVSDFLDEQLARLSNLEKKVLYAIALRRHPVFREQLQQDTIPFAQVENLVSALYSLRSGRSLIERDEHGFYMIDPVMLKHLTTRFVEDCANEIANAIRTETIHFSELFITHALLSPTDLDEQLKAEQIRRIVKPIQAKLQREFPQPHALETHLQHLLSQLQRSPLPNGYAISNITHILTL